MFLSLARGDSGGGRGEGEREEGERQGFFALRTDGTNATYYMCAHIK